MGNKLKVLVICDYKIEFQTTTNLVDFTVMFLPSRRKLEQILFNHTFDCVLPLISSNKSFDYDLLYILEIYKCNVFGNSWINNLIIRDKNISLKTSTFKKNFEIWTRYNYKQKLKKISPNEYPILIEYTNCNIEEKHLIIDSRKLSQFADEILKNEHCIEEVFVWKKYIFDSFVHLSIWGNTPYTFETFSCGDIDTDRMILIAYELFNSFSFENYAHFNFGIIDNECFLLDIKCSNCLTLEHIERVLKLYNFTFIQFLYLCILLCLTKKNSVRSDLRLIDLASALPINVNHLIPLDLKIEKGNYSYNDVCKELRKRLLHPDERNKYDFLKLTSLAIENLPPTSPNSYYLGELDYNYEQMLSGFETIPLHPQNEEDVLLESIKVLNGQTKWHSPLTMYNVCSPVMMNTVAASAVTNMFNPNGMIKGTSAGYLTMEKQIVRQLSNLVKINEKDSAGVFVAGGKVCLTYGIKCGLNRCHRACGFDTEPVVITSDANHFSIESICYQLGIPTDKCIRIPLLDNQTVDLSHFEKAVEDSFKMNIPIACVIVSGGNTMHASVENIKNVNDVIEDLVVKYKVNYKPYIYYDMVVCWPWLFFQTYNFETNPLSIEPNVLLKIKHITDLFRHSNLADGFGFDFHKCGFSPYTTSIFLTKFKKELYNINQKEETSEKDSCYYTFTNSRCTTDIISAWNVLQSVGVEGFQSYVANMLCVADAFSVKLSEAGFCVIGRDYTYGFGTIILAKSPMLDCNHEKLLDSPELIEINNKYMFGLSERFKMNNITNICVRYLPNYTLKEKSISVLSVFPISVNIDKFIAQKICQDIIEIKKDFDTKCLQNNKTDFGSAPTDVPR